ncbi:MAG: sugar transferase [Candidatus Zixiibacteriota bacterium]
MFLSGNRYIRKGLLILFGQSCGHLTASASVLTASFATGITALITAEMLVTMALIRFLYCATRGPRPVMTFYRFRRDKSRVALDELKISIAFAAACFLLRWPVSVTGFGIFVAVNAAGQLVVSHLSRLVSARLSRVDGEKLSQICCRRIIIVGTGALARKTADEILDSPETDTSVAGFLDFNRKGLWRYRDIPLIGHPRETGVIIANCQVDAIVIAVEPEDLPQTRSVFEVAETMGVAVCFVPEVFESKVTRVRTESIGRRSLLVYRAVPENEILLSVKSLVDRIGALCGLIVISPVLFLTALAIKLDSRGPVFFKQTRSGLNGKPFKLYKFRTMCQGADRKKNELAALNEMSGPVFKIRNDPRVTRVGRLLRKTSLDELPQLINVLKGEMSLVGPRPPLPTEVAEYAPWQHRKLSVKPGVTCTWQVSGRNNIDFEDWMRLDLEYIDNWSLWEDTKIIAKTIPAVIKGSGAS